METPSYKKDIASATLGEKIFKMNKSIKFYDGKLSSSILVQIDQDMHGVFVKDGDFHTLAYYAYPDLAIIEMPTDSLPGVISSLTTPDMRLLIEDPQEIMFKSAGVFCKRRMHIVVAGKFNL